MARPKSPADPFPLIVGVTGHRDIPPAAQDALRHTVSTVLSGLQKQFGQDAVFVLSALAQGADQLVAGIAFELGLRLIAVSPMPLDDYRATLQDDPAAAATFEQYWASAQLRLVLPWVTGNAQPRDHKLQYEQLGAVLSRYSHVLLALWDGQGAWHTLHTDAERQAVRGGTAHVLHLRRNDEREAEDFRRSPLFEHGLNGVADIHQHPVAGRRRLVLQQEQADVALHALSGAARGEAVDRDDLHGSAETHHRWSCFW